MHGRANLLLRFASTFGHAEDQNKSTLFIVYYVYSLVLSGVVCTGDCVENVLKICSRHASAVGLDDKPAQLCHNRNLSSCWHCYAVFVLGSLSVSTLGMLRGNHLFNKQLVQVGIC